MTKNKLAIIGGSGLYDVEEFTNRKFIKIDTPWGRPSDDILKTTYNNKEVFFLPRHGKGHFISPSKINFRANIDALKQLGVTDIISISAVGSLKEELARRSWSFSYTGFLADIKLGNICWKGDIIELCQWDHLIERG